MRKLICFILAFLLVCPASWAAYSNTGGDSDYINIAAGPNIGDSEAFSISLWVRATANGDIAFQYQNSNPLIYFGTGQLAGQGTAGKATLILRNSGGGGLQGFSSATTITGGTWYHIGATRKGSSEAVEIYVNGVDDGGATWGTGGTINLSGGSDHFISTSGGAPFVGDIEEVAFWHHTDDNPLTAEDMAKLGKSRVRGMPLQIDPIDLIGYWPLNEYADGSALNTSASGYRDQSGKGNHGTGVDADGDSRNIATRVLTNA